MQVTKIPQLIRDIRTLRVQLEEAEVN